MPGYQAPVEEAMFLLNEVLPFARRRDLPGFAEAGPDLVEAVLREGARFCENILQPLNRSGDREGCQRGSEGAVTTPAGFKEAYRAYAEGGWVGLSADPAFGGQGLPYVLTALLNEFVSSANMAFGMYPGLSMGAIAAIHAHGTPEQKALYLPPLVEGRWSGTMNLTEPQCGTDLGLIKTKATPKPDGGFAISGAKIFISAGEHDLTENIIHLVLARIEGAPEGVKGLSLFIVPKILPASDGALGARNGVICAAIERKMGIHANATCAMTYDGATGFLLGAAHRGLAAMFTMMNEARLAVGVQGLALSEAAYQTALGYARERLQGRALSGPREPGKPADPIIVHPDIRLTLLSIKAFNEAGRALALSAALQADIARRSPDPAERRAAEDRLGLLTPVIKGVLTDIGFSNTVAAQQVLGGHGYIADWGLEQFVRDARIAMIYEGANGIQALDLVGRKLPREGGRAVTAFMTEIAAFVRSRQGGELAAFVGPLAEALEDLRQATLWFMRNGLSRPDNAAAGSSDYMHLFGLVALASMWALIAEAALARKAARRDDAARMDAKLAVGRFFMARTLPETRLRLARIVSGADPVMNPPAESF